MARHRMSTCYFCGEKYLCQGEYTPTYCPHCGQSGVFEAERKDVEAMTAWERRQEMGKLIASHDLPIERLLRRASKLVGRPIEMGEFYVPMCQELIEEAGGGSRPPPRRAA